MSARRMIFMEKILMVTFDSADAADRALARLRSRVDCRSVELQNSPYGAAPAVSPFSAVMLFPHRAMNEPIHELNASPGRIGSRAILTSEIMGLPIYRNAQTELQLTLNEADAERARALLVNLGGHDTQLL